LTNIGSSISATDLLLEVDGALPNNSGLFFYGMAQSQRPFGDGTLRVGVESDPWSR
jgi:hypothetical protein